MKYILSLIIGGALVVSGFGQTRNVLVGTNNTVVQPTNFWSADASNARTGLGLGSAATSPVSAFQSSSATLSNLASSNGGILTNIQASNIVGSIAASNIPSVTFTGINGTLSIIQGGTGATNAANARQNLGSTTVGDAVFIATNAASARTALGSTTIGGNIFTATDAAAVRSLLSLGTASTNPASAFQPASTNLTLLASNDGSSLTNLNISGLGTISISNISGLQSALDGKLATNGSAANLTSFPATILQTTSAITNFPAGLLRANGDGSGLTNLPIPATASNVLSTVPIAKGGTGATNASDARINLGATTVGNSVFTSTNAAAARTALSLGTASTSASTDFQPSSSALTNLAANNGGSLTNITAGNIAGTVGLASNITGVAALATNVSGIVALANGGTGGTNAATARSGIGIGTTNTLTIAGLVSQNLTISAGGGITLQSVMTNSDSFRTNIGLPWIGLTNTTASGFRTALELGTAATNPASAFQPSSSVLTNIAANNGGSLTNLQASNLVGTIAASNIPTVNLTNISGVLAVNKGGTGATNASDARTALGATTVGNSVFTATNAEAARTALSLGSAATSAVTTFQPANANLTNLSTNNGASLTGIPISGVVNLQSNLDAKLATNGNGSGLTSITAANITGTVALASNITGTASLATNVTGTVAIANGGTGATNVAGARTSLGATTVGNSLFTLVNPSAVRFLRLNADNTATALSASDFRTALSLGTAATNAETSFQPASTNLTTLAANNGSGLTNLALSNVVGLQSALNGKLPTNGSASGLTDFVGTTNPATARTNLGLGWSALTNTDATNFRNAIGLGATNNAFAGLSVGSLNTNLSTNNSSVFGVQNFIDSNAQNSFAFGGANTVSNVPTGGGSVVMGLLGRMTNQGAFLFNGVPQGGTAGNSRGNNTFAVNASNGIYLNGPIFLEFEQGAGTDQGLLLLGAGGDVTKAATNVSTGTTAFVGWDGFGYTAFGAGAARTNLDIPWTGLTNTNATTFQAALFGSNTNPVLVNTNGSVVSPTNFWQVAPISTTVQYQTNVTGTSTNAATNSRNLFLFSLSPSVSGITNTVTLPTNPATTFEGDRATITHLAQTTNAVTAVRQLGAATNLITLNQLDETVLLMYRGGAWMLADNISYIEPIYFSGTNAAANAAASRTNLGLGWGALTNTNSATDLLGYNSTNNTVVATQRITFPLLGVASGTAATPSLTYASGTNLFGTFASTAVGIGPHLGFSVDGTRRFFVSTNTIRAELPISFGTTTNAAETRSNLGLGATWLTNTDVTNFRTGIGLGTTNSVVFEQVTAGGNVINGSGFFYSGDLNIGFNLEEGYIKDFSSNTVIDWGNGTEVVFGRPLALGTNAATTRTNLGLGATNNVSFSNVTASGTLTATGTVTATTNLVVNGFVDFSTNHTNSNPATNNQINDFIEIRVGTNQFWLPVYK